MIIRQAHNTHKLLPVDTEKPIEAKPFEEWREFTSAIGEFKVMLPAVPLHAEESLPVPESKVVLQYNMYASESNDGTTFMISLITYPEEIDTSKPENMLENVMNEMVSANPTNSLRSLNFHEFLGHKALDFFIESPEIVVNSRAFVSGKTLYLLTMIDKKEQYDEEEFLYFINSFELLGQQMLEPAA